MARLSQSKKTFEIDTSKSSVQYIMVSCVDNSKCQGGGGGWGIKSFEL